jgi:hypothetical protein
VRLYNRRTARFNNRAVDDQVEGYSASTKIPGHVRHDTFYSLHEVFSKLNSYTTRLVKYQKSAPPLAVELSAPSVRSLNGIYLAARGVTAKWAR